MDQEPLIGMPDGTHIEMKMIVMSLIVVGAENDSEEVARLIH